MMLKFSVVLKIIIYVGEVDLQINHYKYEIKNDNKQYEF